MPSKIKKSVNQIVGIIVILFVTFFIVLPLLFPGHIGATNGSHTGVVTAVEYNSNIIWGANLAYFKTSRESTQEDIYCVNDEGVKNQLVEAEKNKKEITVYFKNDFFMWKWQCNGGQSIIYKVQ